MNNTFRDCRSKVNVTAYWVTLALKWHLAALLYGCSIGNVNLAVEYQATWQIISNTIIFAMVPASIMSCCDFEHSQISAQDTLLASGLALGDDIMFHILVAFSIIPIQTHGHTMWVH